MNETDALELMRQAASIMGRARTEKKALAARENGKRGGRPEGTGRPLSEETKERMRAAYQARAERELQKKMDIMRQQLKATLDTLATTKPSSSDSDIDKAD